MTRILVTGASGALGRAVVARLETLGEQQVVTLGRREESGLDLCDRAALLAALDAHSPDLILHLAARFQGELEDLYPINVGVAKTLLDWAVGREVRVVLVGSAAEYGIVTAADNPIAEDRVLAPVSAYGLSKAWQTQLLGVYAARGVDVVCARVFNLIGPGISSRLFAGRLEDGIRAVLAGEATEIRVGDLSAIRDYLSIDEAARQLLRIAGRGRAGEIYHVASGVPVSMRELARKRLAAAGLSLDVLRESPSDSTHVGHDVPAIHADMRKTQRLSDQPAKHCLKGLAEMNEGMA